MGRKYANHALGLLILVIFVGCGSDGEKSLVDPSGGSSASQTTTLPVMLPSNNNAASTTPQQQQVNASAPALNPAHGQPGHRCDLAVGAPLPGAAQVNINPQPSVAASNPVVSATAASPKLNPAHGQPGHRCDISVGAPLPSAGSPAQPTPTVAAPPTNNPTPVLNLPNSSAGIKINPAHGQPGHRCDIAVGAPIK